MEIRNVNQGIAEVGINPWTIKTRKARNYEKFANNEIQILVATSVIEVGVNVVRNEYYHLDGPVGIAQLHQMRGRVRHGDHQSYYPISKATQEATIRRLQLVASISDGFELAEDLKKWTRGLLEKDIRNGYF